MEFEITAEQLKAHLDQKLPIRLVDVREPWEFQISHIAGSVPLPMADIPARANRELDPDEHIVVICHHGVRSANVTHWLRQQGFENSQSLVGGIDRWSRLIDSAIAVY